MSNHSKLLEFNPQLDQKLLVEDTSDQCLGVYLDNRELYRTSQVSNHVQIAIGEAYAAALDLSLSSVDLERLSVIDELRQELNPGRFNFLLSMDLSRVEHCLDLTQDFGGVAHYLSSHCGQLDAVRVDIDQARLTADRCAEQQNLSLVCESIKKLKLPMQHYDLVVIGALETLQMNSDERLTLLAKLRDSLSENGVVVVNAPNQEGLSRWFDAQGEQQNGVPYKSLYGLDNDRYTRAGIQQCIDGASYAASQIYASYSREDQVSNLFSEQYLAESGAALNHFYRLGMLGNDSVCEYLLFKQIQDNDNSTPTALLDTASRFVCFLSKDPASIQAVINLAFAHYPGRGRKPKWRAVTERQHNSAKVTKRRLFDEGSSSKLISQNLDPQNFKQGTVLVASWLDAAVNNKLEKFAGVVKDYQQWLHTFAESDPERFQSSAYDLLPFNLIDSGDESAELLTRYQAIDTEWVLHAPLTTDIVLFRALFWFAFENRAVLTEFCEQLNLATLADFVRHFHPSLESSGDLSHFAELEESVQAEIDQHFRAGSVSQSLGQSISGADNSELAVRHCQVQWGQSAAKMNAAGARISEWQVDPKASTVVAIPLPSQRGSDTFLRIDPMECEGLFRVESLLLTSSSDEAVLSLNSAAACVSAAELVNIQLASDGETCIALNQDPHFLIDLSEQPNLDDAAVCKLELSVVHSPEYRGALENLTQTVSERNTELDRLANKLNTLAAELEYTQQRLSDAIEHRTDLNQMLNEVQREKRANASNYNLQLHEQRLAADARYTSRVRELNRRLTNLNDQLVDQIRHNQEVDLYLIQRPSTRAKRLLARTAQRVTGRGEQASEPEQVSADLAPVDVTPEANPAPTPAIEIDKQIVTADSETIDAESANRDVEEELIGQNREDYQLWLQQNALSTEQISAIKSEIDAFAVKPVFSILVPIYNTDPDYLLPMIRSVQAQLYPYWQLVLVDDCSPKKWLRTILDIEAAKDERITLQMNAENQGIALTSNDALALATGDYIALLDHDDEISIDALYENAKVINQCPDAGLIYSDEDKMDLEGNRLEPYFKPDYSPDLLDTNNYICHFTVIKKSIADRIGGFRATFDGSQDHDIILRAIAESGQVVHIPKILYHWRKIPGSTAVAYDSKSYAWEAGRRAVEDCLKQHDNTARVEFGSLKGTYRVFREIRGEPLVSIIIPFKDKPELLRACVGSILKKTSYPNFEIVGVNNSSSNPETFACMEQLSASDQRVRFVDKDMPFNFSAICNYGVEQSKGEYILLLNNDVTLDGADWLERLLEHAQRADVGAVGGKLLYPDGRIQHAGIVVGMVGTAGHPHKFFPDNHIGYHGRLHMVYNVSAVTGAMLMVRKDKYLQVGGLDEENFAVAYNDVDFCLKLMSAGYTNLFTPHSRGIHHESLSRGYEDTDEKLARLKREQSHFLSKWADFLRKGDPYYNPNLSLLNEHFSLKFEAERAAETSAHSS